jgi:hypothetical protein
VLDMCMCRDVCDLVALCRVTDYSQENLYLKNRVQVLENENK